MSSKNDTFSSSSSFSSFSSSSQLSTPRAFQNQFLQKSTLPKFSSQEIVYPKKSPALGVDKANCSYGFSLPKSNEELMGEIAEIETEILQLERHLLSLYRTSFGDHLSAILLKLPDDSSPSHSSVSSSLISLSEMDKIKRSESGNPSLADLLGLNTLSPNKLSEDILRLICAIHLKLSDKGHRRLIKNSKNEDVNEEYGEELGVVIHKLYLAFDNMKSVESMLQRFRSLVQKLEKVDPATMGREEKLAFWINIHNAIVMHGYIVNGISQATTIRKIFKAAFNIGGEWINAYDVQSWILGIRACQTEPRLRTLFSPAKYSKTSRGKHAYALEYAEPLIHFALSTGASTDPMVRVYTSEGIFQELRQARKGFIKTSVDFEKETRILLPKIIYNYARDISLNITELLNIISDCLSETQRTIVTRVVKKKRERCIRWIDNDSSFRYIINGELLREF